MSRLFNRIGLAVALLLLAAIMWWLPNAFTPRGGLFEPEKRHEEDYVVENFVATVMDPRGYRKHELRATRAVHFADDDSIVIDRPYLVQYQADGPPIHTRADQGFTHTGSKEILMRGNVRVTRTAKSDAPAGEITAQEMKVQLE